MGRDMTMPKGLLKQLEVEGGRKSGKAVKSVVTCALDSNLRNDLKYITVHFLRAGNDYAIYGTLGGRLNLHFPFPY